MSQTLEQRDRYLPAPTPAELLDYADHIIQSSQPPQRETRTSDKFRSDIVLIPLTSGIETQTVEWYILLKRAVRINNSFEIGNPTISIEIGTTTLDVQEEVATLREGYRDEIIAGKNNRTVPGTRKPLSHVELRQTSNILNHAEAYIREAAKLKS